MLAILSLSIHEAVVSLHLFRSSLIFSSNVLSFEYNLYTSFVKLIPNYYILFKYILLIMLLQFSQLPPLSPLHPAPPTPPASPHLSSCPWVVHISSLSSVSYTIFDLSPSILCLPTVFLIPCTFLFLLFPSPSPLTTLHVMSISLILFLFWLFA